MRINFNSRGIGPVIASVLFMLVAVISLFTFQNWYVGYQSAIIEGIDSSSSQEISTRIDSLIGSRLYVTSIREDLEIREVRIDGVSCDNYSSQRLSSNIYAIELGYCVETFDRRDPEFLIITDIGIYTKTIFLRDANITYIPPPASVLFNPNGNSSYANEHETIVTLSNFKSDSLRYLWSELDVGIIEENFSQSFTSGDLISSPPELNGVVYLWILAEGSLDDEIRIFRSSVFNFDNEAPEITILGDNPLHVGFNTSYVDPGALAMDNILGNLSSSIVTEIDVNTSSPGEYNVSYFVSDIAGNEALAYRTVIVEQLGSELSPANSCKQILDIGHSNGDGIYYLGEFAEAVYCDMTTDGGGWTHLTNPNIDGLLATSLGAVFTHSADTGCYGNEIEHLDNDWWYGYTYTCGVVSNWAQITLTWENVLDAEEVGYVAVSGGDSPWITLNGGGVITNSNSKNRYSMSSGSTCAVNLCWKNSIQDSATPRILSFSGDLDLRAGGYSDGYTWGGTGYIYRVMVR